MKKVSILLSLILIVNIYSCMSIENDYVKDSPFNSPSFLEIKAKKIIDLNGKNPAHYYKLIKKNKLAKNDKKSIFNQEFFSHFQNNQKKGQVYDKKFKSPKYNWEEHKKLKQTNEQKAYIYFREAEVDYQLSASAKKCNLNARTVSCEAFGSEDITSDYDISCLPKGKAAGRKKSVNCLIRTFNDDFRGKFKMPSALKFDTNIYGIGCDFPNPLGFKNKACFTKERGKTQSRNTFSKLLKTNKAAIVQQHQSTLSKLRQYLDILTFTSDFDKKVSFHAKLGKSKAFSSNWKASKAVLSKLQTAPCGKSERCKNVICKNGKLDMNDVKGRNCIYANILDDLYKNLNGNKQSQCVQALKQLSDANFYASEAYVSCGAFVSIVSNLQAGKGLKVDHNAHLQSLNENLADVFKDYHHYRPSNKNDVKFMVKASKYFYRILLALQGLQAAESLVTCALKPVQSIRKDYRGKVKFQGSKVVVQDKKKRSEQALMSLIKKTRRCMNSFIGISGRDQSKLVDHKRFFLTLGAQINVKFDELHNGISAGQSKGKVDSKKKKSKKKPNAAGHKKKKPKPKPKKKKPKPKPKKKKPKPKPKNAGGRKKKRMF